MNSGKNGKSGKIGAENEKKTRSLMMFIKEWIVPIVVAFIFAFIVNRYVIFKIEVPTGSMIPTINVDDRIFVRRVYNKDKFEKGDILVFNSNQEDILLVKRLIGLPGDRVSLINGDLYINDVLVEETYVVNNMDYTDEYLVPEDHFLFFGDNRASSIDARYWDNPFIHKDEVIGKAGLRVSPLKNIGFIK